MAETSSAWIANHDYGQDLDEILEQHLEEYRTNMQEVFGKVDSELVSFGQAVDPNHLWLSRDKILPRRILTKSAIALLPLLVDTDSWGTKAKSYRVPQGEFGPIPHELETGKNIPP